MIAKSPSCCKIILIKKVKGFNIGIFRKVDGTLVDTLTSPVETYNKTKDQELQVKNSWMLFKAGRSFIFYLDKPKTGLTFEGSMSGY